MAIRDVTSDRHWRFTTSVQPAKAYEEEEEECTTSVQPAKAYEDKFCHHVWASFTMAKKLAQDFDSRAA